jgi:modification methylase
MRSDWEIPLCTGPERCRVDGKKGHSTQKPEALLYRVISATTRAGEVVLDPFFGSGTTGAVSKQLHRNWIGIEKEPEYIDLAQKRIDRVEAGTEEKDIWVTPTRKAELRIPFGDLVAQGYLQPGQLLFSPDGKHKATVAADGSLLINGFRGSIHKVGSQVQQTPSCNGWLFWHYKKNRTLEPIDELRKACRQNISPVQVPAEGQN